MKTHIIQDTDIRVVEASANKFNEEHNVKFSQHSTCRGYDGIVTTMVLFYEE